MTIEKLTARLVEIETKITGAENCLKAAHTQPAVVRIMNELSHLRGLKKTVEGKITEAAMR